MATTDNSGIAFIIPSMYTKPSTLCISFTIMLSNFIPLDKLSYSYMSNATKVVSFLCGPSVAGDHMVQTPPYPRANCALGHTKQRFKFVVALF